MKNIEASVSAVLTPEKKEEEEEEEVEEEYHQMENEMIFCLKEAPEYQISAVGRWLENSAGEVIGDADTYFINITSGQRCESVRDCFSGWSEPNENSAEKWETLCKRIEDIGNLEEIICDEKRVEL